MSDCVKVRVASASKIDKSVDFEIVGMKSNKKTQKTVIINTRKDDKRKKGHSKRRRKHDFSRSNKRERNSFHKVRHRKSKY